MPTFSFPGVAPDNLFDHVAGLAKAAESAGFDLVTVMDHFYQIRGVGPATEPMLESYTTLSALAARTSHIRLATLVTGVTYRNPALVAKMVTTIDVISKGRAILGIGAAWNQDEHAGYGFAFPPARERLDRLEEALQIARLMFTQARPSFEGRFYRLHQALNRPAPLQPGGPKILVGGGGEKRTLRLVARYADLSHWFVSSVDQFKHKQWVLERHCEAEGRDSSTIVRLIAAPVLLARDEREARAMTDGPRMFKPAVLDEAVEILRDYVEAGAQGFTFGNPNLSTPELIELAGELKRRLAPPGPSGGGDAVRSGAR
jgi:F420-dependent oxidoreductase-like protein